MLVLECALARLFCCFVALLLFRSEWNNMQYAALIGISYAIFSLPSPLPTIIVYFRAVERRRLRRIMAEQANPADRWKVGDFTVIIYIFSQLFGRPHL